MKKITFFINSLDIGGSEKQLFKLIEYLKKEYRIEVFSFKSGALVQKFKDQKIKIHTANNNFFSFFLLLFYLISNTSHIYHFILPKSYILCGFLTYLSKKKKIMSRRSLNFYHKKYKGISLFLEKILHKKMDYILCNSQKIKKQLIVDEGVSSKKIVCVKNFHIPFNKPLKRSFKYKKNRKNVSFAYVANLIPYKGHIDLIDICSKLNTKNDWRLFLVGDGKLSYKRKLKKYVEQKGLQKKIFFTGLIENMEEVYRSIDFAVSASLEEGSSNFLLEAISMKLPIICYDIGGNKDFFLRMDS